MVYVLGIMELRLSAAKGYLRTGRRVDVIGTQDQESEREAGAFWRELGMRANMNFAVADIREQHNAKRFSSNVEEIKRTSRQYPVHRGVDRALAIMEDGTLQRKRGWNRAGGGCRDSSQW